MFAGKKSAQIREILISESTWEEMTCLFAPSLKKNTGEVVSLKEERKLACSWLSNALRKRLFSPIVDSEINWLLNLLSDDITEKSFSVMDILNNTLTTIRILNNSSDNY